MGNLCNDNQKETSAFNEFLGCNNILVICAPSKFLSIVSRYNRKRPDQSYKLFTDIKSPSLAKADAVLVDNGMLGYYDFARSVKRYANKKTKFFILVDDKYITTLKINTTNKKK